MTRYTVYLESAPDGPCMAHVPGLPGCAVRAPAPSSALELALNAIYDYHALSTFESLEMERRTAVARLQQLSGQERVDVFCPTRWTSHPDEAWTARKVLRRFLEHEREHTDQVAQILAAWRRSKAASQADP